MANITQETSNTPAPCYSVASWGELGQMGEFHKWPTDATEGNPWTPPQSPDLALDNFHRRIEAGEPLVIHGDDNQRCDLTHASDGAQAVGLSLQWQGTGSSVLNIGTGKTTRSRRTIGETVAALHFPGVALNPFPPVVEHQPDHPADVPETLASQERVGMNRIESPGFLPRTCPR